MEGAATNGGERPEEGQRGESAGIGSSLLSKGWRRMPRTRHDDMARVPSAGRRVDLPPLGVPAPPTAAKPWMGLLFMAVGVGVWYLFFVVSPTHPAEPFPGARKWGATAFAAVFFLFGLRFALEGLRAPDWWTLRRFRGGVEPWGEGYRWQPTMKALPPWKAEKRGWAKGCVGLLALAAFAVVMNLVWFDRQSLRGDVWLAYILIPLFTLLIVFILGAGLWEILRQLLFGTPRVRFDSYPVSPGETLRATIEHRGRFGRARNVRLTLACFAQDPPRRETGSARVEAITVLEAVVDPADLAASRRRFPLAIDLPVDAPSTRLVRGDGGRRYWILEVAAFQNKVRATESYSFLVPVYGQSS